MEQPDQGTLHVVSGRVVWMTSKVPTLTNLKPSNINNTQYN